MISKMKLGKIPKLLTKSQNGMSTVVLPLQSHHGNTLFLEEAAEVSLREATEPAASTITTLGSSTLTT
jgi:hypothetical protein